MSETAVLEHAPRRSAVSHETPVVSEIKRLKKELGHARSAYVHSGVGTLDIKKKNEHLQEFATYEHALNDYLSHVLNSQGLLMAEMAREGERGMVGALDRRKHRVAIAAGGATYLTVAALKAPVQMVAGAAVGIGTGLFLSNPIGRKITDFIGSLRISEETLVNKRVAEANQARSERKLDFKEYTGADNLLAGQLSKPFKEVTAKIRRQRFVKYGTSAALGAGTVWLTGNSIAGHLVNDKIFGLENSVGDMISGNVVGGDVAIHGAMPMVAGAFSKAGSVAGTAFHELIGADFSTDAEAQTWNGGGQPNGPFIQNGQPNGPWQPGPQTSHWPTQHVPQPRPYMPSPQSRPMPMPQRGGMNPVEGAFIGEGLRILDGALNHGQHGMYPGYEGGYGHSGMPTPPPGEGWHLESRTWDGHGWRNHWVRAEHHVVITHHEEIRHEATQAAAPAPHKEVCVPNAETADTYIPIHALGHAPWAANIGEMLQDNRIEDAANAFVNSHDLPAEAKPYLIDALQKLKTECQHDSNPSHFFSDKIEDGQKFLAMLWKSKADHTAHILGAGKNIGGSFALGHDVTGKMFAFDYPDAQGVMHHDSGFIPMDCRNITLLSDTTVCPPENVAAVAGSAVSGEHVRPTLEQEIARLGGIQKVDHMLDDLGNPDANQFLDGKPGHYLAEHYPALPADEKAIVHPLQEAIHIDQPRLIATERAMHSAAELSAHHPTVKEMLTDTLK